MYWLGPAIFVHLLATLVVLLAGSPAATTAYANYLLHLAPLVFVNVLVHGQALKRWLHPSLRPRAMGQAVVLVFATWPVYTLAWGMALLRIPLAFRPTPKRASGQIAPAWLVPQAGAAVALAIAAGYRLARPDGAAGLLVAGAAVALALPHLLFFGLLARQPADTGQPGLVVLDDLAQGE